MTPDKGQDERLEARRASDALSLGALRTGSRLLPRNPASVEAQPRKSPDTPHYKRTDVMSEDPKVLAVFFFILLAGAVAGLPAGPGDAVVLALAALAVFAGGALAASDRNAVQDRYRISLSARHPAQAFAYFSGRPARVELLPFLDNFGARAQRPIAGLAATVQVTIGRCRIIQLILSPLQRRARHSGR